MVLLRSIFQMGVPVSGKNLFLEHRRAPTWHTIRRTTGGMSAARRKSLVAMNAETAREDVLSLDPGRAVVYDEPLKLNALRTDLIFYPVPFDKIVAEVCPDAKLRRLVKNMIYDGILSHLLSVDLGEMEHALSRQLGKKPKAMQLNMAALEAARSTRRITSSSARTGSSG
jgi:2-oxoglutarate ferredoxin oxidoreductase subunit alpha